MARDLFEYHPVFGYRFIPHLTARVRHEGGGYLVQSNNLGFRNSADVTTARGDRPRVLVFGDSYTAGDGVSNRYRYTDLAAEQLGDVEIVNFGLPGSGTDQQYLAWREYGQSIECDLIVLAPMVENIVRNIDTHRVTQSASDGRLVRRAKPWFSLEDNALQLHHNPVPRDVRDVDPADAPLQEDSESFLRRVNRAIDRHVPGFRPMTQRLRRISWPPQYDDTQDPAWRLMYTILKTWISEAQAPVLLFPIPTFGHIEGGIDARPYQTRFLELSRITGTPLVDPLETFLARPLSYRKDCRFVHDEHPNRQGHEVLAESFAAAIESALEERKTA